jgi:Bacterial Ig-like domain (group 3)/FG-GAP-like repeat
MCMKRVIGAIFILLLTCAGSQLTFAQRFIVPPTYLVGHGPAGMASADFNGDGKPDLVIANALSVSPNISVSLNDGKGGFLPAVFYSVGADVQPYSVVVADFNGDGKLDIAASGFACCGDVVSILLGNGDGTFQPGVSYSVGGQLAGSVVASDINGDGKLDLVVPSDSATGLNYAVVGVLLGNGDGTFQTVITTTLTTLGGIRASLVVADFNKDSKPDVAFLVEGVLTVLLGNGNGTFQSPVVYGSGELAAIAVGDMNNDGNVDLVGVNFAGTVDVFLGNGNGTFQTAVASGLSVNSSTITLADLNGDGKLDVVVGGASPSAAVVFMGNGTATLSAPVIYAVGSGPGSPGSVAIADLNGDGHPDVICSNGSDETITVLFGSATGKLAAPVVALNPAGPLVVGDFNNNGNLDVATSVFGRNEFSVFLGEGNGALHSPANFAVGNSPESITTADFNGDGKLDIATANTVNVSVAFGNGDGTFQRAVNYGASSNLGSPSSYVTAVDVNGDGKPDLAVVTRPVGESAQVAIMLNSGNGTFLPATLYTVTGYPESLAFADFNGDGKVDMATFDYKVPYDVSVLLGNGDGTFQKPVNHEIGAPCIGLVAADVNGDGKQDLVAGCGVLAVFLGNGDGTFQPVFAGSSSLGGIDIATGDFNGDGKVDIAALGYDFGVFYGNGDGTFNYVDYGLEAKNIAIGDFNGDHAPDVAINNGVGVFVLLNTGGTHDVLTSSPNPSTVQQTVTFKALIGTTVKSSATGTPTGSVTFRDGNSTLATVTLQKGAASFQTSALSAGTHKITAAYSGDGNFNPNVSVVLSQVVQP